jgi:hypothetical protein
MPIGPVIIRRIYGRVFHKSTKLKTVFMSLGGLSEYGLLTAFII